MKLLFRFSCDSVNCRVLLYFFYFFSLYPEYRVKFGALTCWNCYEKASFFNTHVLLDFDVWALCTYYYYYYFFLLNFIFETVGTWDPWIGASTSSKLSNKEIWWSVLFIWTGYSVSFSSVLCPVMLLFFYAILSLLCH